MADKLFKDLFKIRPLSESDIDQVIENAGGARAHPDADRRKQKSADYVLGNCIIELKALDDEGLAKPERQAKLANLFGSLHPNRPGGFKFQVQHWVYLDEV